MEIFEAKPPFDSLMPLLLIGDESEAMIDRYIADCRLFVAKRDGRPCAVCAVLVASDGIVEIKNLAVMPEHQRQGLGSAMLRHVENLYKGHKIILGTGETPGTLDFYKSNGYTVSHVVADFFTDNYPDPIVEEGITLKDMIYLSKHT